MSYSIMLIIWEVHSLLK